MRPPEFSAAAIATLLRQQKIATLPELMAALGTDARRTVFRKLKELSSRTSYSHRGRYYTLDDVAAFDELGLWAHEEVWFSIKRPQFSWTLIRGESNVQGGGGNGSIEERAGEGVGGDGGSPEGDRSARRRRGR